MEASGQQLISWLSPIIAKQSGMVQYRNHASCFTSAALSRICIQCWKATLMPTLKLHYEGWVSLPAVLRQQLGLNGGNRLEVDLVDGTIVLRPAATAEHPAPRADQEVAINSMPRPRPRHWCSPMPCRPVASQNDHASTTSARPTPKRPRGRPRAVRVPEPEPAQVRTVCSEPWKLPRRKEDLQPQAASVEHAAPPSPHPGSGQKRGGVRRRKSGVRFATSRCASLPSTRTPAGGPQAISWSVRLPT